MNVSKCLEELQNCLNNNDCKNVKKECSDKLELKLTPSKLLEKIIENKNNINRLKKIKEKLEKYITIQQELKKIIEEKINQIELQNKIKTEIKQK